LTVHCQHLTVHCWLSMHRHSTIGRPLSTVHINTQPSTVNRQHVNTQPSMLTVNSRHSYRYINWPFPLHGQVSHLVAPQLLQLKTYRLPKLSADTVVPHCTYHVWPLAWSGPCRFTQGSFCASHYLLLHYTFTLGSTPSSLTLAFYYHMLPPHPLFMPATKDNHLLMVKRLLTSMCNGTWLRLRSWCCKLGSTICTIFFCSVWSSPLKDDHMSALSSSLPMPCTDSGHGSAIRHLGKHAHIATGVFNLVLTT